MNISILSLFNGCINKAMKLYLKLNSEGSDINFMESIMRELENAFKAVNAMADGREREIRLDTLNKIQRFIMEYPWGSGKNAEMFKKYGKLSNKDFGRFANLKESNVRLIHKRCSDKIREKMGYNKIYGAVNLSIEDVIRINKCMNIVQKDITAESVIPTYILNKVSDMRASVDYHVSDLTSEIEYLKRHSKKTISRELKEMNKDRLSYVFKVLNSDVGYLLDKKQEILSQLLNEEEPK